MTLMASMTKYLFSKKDFFIFAFALIFLVLPLQAKAQNHNWDLTDLVKNEQQWKKQLTKTKEHVKKIKSYEGRLGQSAKVLEEGLKVQEEAYKELSRLCTWAWLQRSTDTMSSSKISNGQKCSQEITKISEASSYIKPEIIKIGKNKIDSFLKENKNLDTYSQFFRTIFDSQTHTLSSQEEGLMSSLYPILQKSAETHTLLLSNDVPWQTVKLSTGDSKINTTEYTKHRGSENRNDRKKVFQAYYNSLAGVESTAGSTLAQSVMTRNSIAKIKNYKNALDHALSSEAIPEKVYRTLVSEVNKSLPTLHRYLKLRGKILGLKKQEYYDAYPIVLKAPRRFPLKDTQSMTLKAVEPLGSNYVEKLKHATQQNWMSVYPDKNKVPGAFMSGSAYDVHPYVFLNHQDNYSSASTYAHEWGHALHTLYTNETQPYAKSDYSLFVAEIAAITNEVLLNQYAIKTAKTDDEKLYYLNEALESIRTTYFRQTQFAEFELAIHEEAEKTGALTGQRISEIFGQIQRKYYGHNKNIMNIDPLYFKEWVFVPHFYSGFYVFNYATSIAGAYFFSDKILNNDKDALNKYITALKAGGSKYPHEILKEADLDLSTTDPYKVIEKKAKQLMDEMELLLKKKGQQKINISAR